MIPVKLYLRNFMSYGEEGETLDFTRFRTACLSGDNGNGKSALLDAITWALWGMARGVSGTGAGADDLIRMAPGVDEAQVEFQFQVDSTLYRAIRTRSRRRGGVLQFQIHDGTQFRPLSGSTMKATQEIIDQALPMDYRTFINSAFILQGRADEFTRQIPTDRKKILSDILGLGRYDRLEARCRELARDARRTAQAQTIEMARIEEELKAQPIYQQEISRCQAELDRARKALEQAEKDLDQAKADQSALLASRNRLDDLGRIIARARSGHRQLAEQIEQFQQRVSDYQQLTSQEEVIAAGFSRLEEARAEERLFSQKQSSLSKLSDPRQALVIEIEREENQLKSKLAQLQNRQAELAPIASSAPQLDQQANQLNQQVLQLRDLEPKIAKAQGQVESLQADQAVVRNQIAHLESEMEEIREKIRLLKEARAKCPLCQKELSPEECQELVEGFQAQRRSKIEGSKEKREKLRDIEKAIGKIRQQVQSWRKQISALPKLERSLGEVGRRKEEAAQAADQMKEIQQTQEELERQLAEGQFALKQRTRLSEVEKEIIALGYDASTHQQVSRRVEELAKFASLKLELEAAQRNLPSDQQTLERMEASSQAQAETIKSGDAETRRLREELKALPRLQARVAELAQTRQQLRERDSALARELAEWQSKHARCEELKAQVKDRQKAKDQAEHEHAIYSDLATAFSKNGLQALIIENAIPELADHANQLLRRITDGRMQLNFITQKDSSKGQAIETLDIQISDELGTRRYEMYSGGEAFRLNFAIRVALSRLLARRAGTRLQTLIIDEGFGTQDRPSREKLIQAIQAIQDEFERIIVITHIEEMKEAFEEQIEVTKDEEGSHLTQASIRQ